MHVGFGNLTSMSQNFLWMGETEGLGGGEYDMIDRAANNNMNAYTVRSKRGKSVLIFG